MTKGILLLAARIGCVFTGLSAAAQPAINVLALNTGTLVAIASPNRPPDEPDPIIQFCGESLPTDQPDITERWDRILSRQVASAGHLAQLKRRASVIFPFIEPILRQHRIPADFKYLPLFESDLSNRAVSRRGAAGFWQIMPGTAQSLGLSVSHRRDERFNLRKATHAVCRHLNELYEQFGSWMLAAAAYNAGPNYIAQLIRQHPRLHPMALPYRAAETKAYLFQAMAIKELFTHPNNYRDRLSSRHLADLSDAETPVSSAERATILASFDLDETAFSDATPDGAAPDDITSPNDTLPKSPAVVLAASVTDSATTAALLTADEPGADVMPTDEPLVRPAPIVPVTVTVPAVRLMTRSLSEGSLAEGKLCVFQVVQPVTLNGRAFAVGDMIQAHIEIMDVASGRVFLRTDQLTTARTGETVSINFVATGQPRQPGVPLPTRLEGWQLNWEAM